MKGREGGLDSIYIEIHAEFQMKLDPVLTKISRAHARYPVLTVLLLLLAVCIYDACVVLRSRTLAQSPTILELGFAHVL